MKKVLLVFLLIFIFCGFIGAKSGGVSPAYFEEDFRPFLEKEYTFNYFFDDTKDVEFYLSGDLTQYAEITDIRNSFGRTFVTVKISLPESVEKPGINRLRLGGKETAEVDGGLGINFDVGATIRIRVPYPGKYAVGNLNIWNINEGDNARYELEVFSRGDDEITVSPRLEVRNFEGVKKLISLESRNLLAGNKTTYGGNFSSDELAAGSYNLIAFVDYGGSEILEIQKEFNIGEFRIDITNHSKNLEVDKVNRFHTNIQSFWNDPIDDVYMTLEVPEYPQMNSQSTELNLNPWQETFLLSFVDTKNVDAKEVQGIIILYYGDEVKTKEVTLKINHPTNWALIGLIIGIIVIIIIILLLIIFIIYLLKREKKHGKKKK